VDSSIPVRAKGIGLPKEDVEDRRKVAAKRAAAGLSIARLISRGLVKNRARGWWRLTARGLKVARQLYPQIKKPTKSQLAFDITLRIAAADLEDRRRLDEMRERRYRRTKAYQAELETLPELEQALKARSEAGSEWGRI
jgi:hypothetical protein